jgi:Flp pilus assembly protein TadG
MSASRRIKGPGLFGRNDAGASAVEFALVFPMLLLLTFGIVEFGLVSYQINLAEKATQLGARKAVTWDPVAIELATFTPTGGGLGAGDPLPPGLQVDIVCENTGCTGTGAITTPTLSGTAFTAIVNAMKAVYPEIRPQDVVITYKNIGLGFVGKPGGSVVPAVTVSLRNLDYDFVLLDAAVAIASLGTVNLEDIIYPSFSATLTGEDLSDGVS